MSINNFSNRLSDQDIQDAFYKLYDYLLSRYAFCKPPILKRLGKGLLANIYINPKYQDFRQVLKEELSKNFQNNNSWQLPENIETEEGFRKWLIILTQ